MTLRCGRCRRCLVVLFPLAFLLFGICFLIPDAAAYSPSKSSTFSSSSSSDRRAFLSKCASSTATVVSSILAFQTATAEAAAASINVKVSPLAHTFVLDKEKTKPIRENDATRLLTNARVVLLFYSAAAADAAADAELRNILDLTVARKQGQGPGVTPGMIHVLKKDASALEISSSKNNNAVLVVEEDKSNNKKDIRTILSALPSGDTLLILQQSQGTAANGKVVATLAKDLGVNIGGAVSGGILSVLVNGPTQNLVTEESGYPCSSLLWYSENSK